MTSEADTTAAELAELRELLRCAQHHVPRNWPQCGEFLERAYKILGANFANSGCGGRLEEVPGVPDRPMLADVESKSDKRYQEFVRVQDEQYNSAGNEHTRFERSILGLSSEAGELCSLMRREVSTGNPINRIDAIDEIGDAHFNCVRALSDLGATIEDARMVNMAKLQRRSRFGKDKKAERDMLIHRFPDLVGARR